MLISKQNFAVTQKAVGWLKDGLPEQGFTPRLVNTYWAKGAAIMVCQDQDTCDWLARLVPTLVAWEGSRFKIVGLEALPTFNTFRPSLVLVPSSLSRQLS
jgi:hypothetical protein